MEGGWGKGIWLKWEIYWSNHRMLETGDRRIKGRTQPKIYGGPSQANMRAGYGGNAAFVLVMVCDRNWHEEICKNIEENLGIIKNFFFRYNLCVILIFWIFNIARQTRMVHMLSIVRTIHTGCEHGRKKKVWVILKDTRQESRQRTDRLQGHHLYF